MCLVPRHEVDAREHRTGGPVVILMIVAFSVLLSLVLGIGAGALAARRLARTPPLTLFGR